jgi:hypothetical protein
MQIHNVSQHAQCVHSFITGTTCASAAGENDHNFQYEGCMLLLFISLYYLLPRYDVSGTYTSNDDPRLETLPLSTTTRTAVRVHVNENH